MKRTLTGILILLLSVLHPLDLFAQEKTEMADLMRSNGRIYVVVAVMTTILLGLFLYVFRLDRKISKWEKEK